MNLSPLESALSWFLFWAKEFNCPMNELLEMELELLLDLTITKAKLTADPIYYIDEVWK